MFKTRFISMLALLLTAATGARAAWTGGTYTATANENLGAITVNGDATLTINSDVTVTITGGINVASGTLTVTGPGTLVVNGAKGNDGNSDFDGGPGGPGGVAISGNIIVQGGATVTATGGTGGNGGNGEWDGGTGGNGGVAFAGTLTYKSGTVTANGGSAGSGGWSDDEERYASSGSAGKAFANDVDFTQTTGYSVTNGTSTIGSVLNQTKVVISGGTPIPTGYSVSLKSVTEDASSWQGKAGEGDYQSLPLEGVAANTAVSVKYNGTKKVKSVKAVKKVVLVTSITLNKTETSIKVGSTETLSVTSVLPEEATDKTYTWKTSDASKATVDQDGKVTAVAAGTVTIYAEANDGSGVKGNCTVTVAPAAAEGHALSASAVGEIVGSDGKAYAVADKDNLPSGVTKVAMIAYVSGSNGLAIALADEGSLNWATAKSTCEAKTPAFTNGTWHLPSQAEWNNMFSANGGDEESYTGLNTIINNAGGTILQSGSYWSSSEYSPGVGAHYVHLDDGYADWGKSNEALGRKVRACLAF